MLSAPAVSLPPIAAQQAGGAAVAPPAAGPAGLAGTPSASASGSGSFARVLGNARDERGTGADEAAPQRAARPLVDADKLAGRAAAARGSKPGADAAGGPPWHVTPIKPDETFPAAAALDPAPAEPGASDPAALLAALAALNPGPSGEAVAAVATQAAASAGAATTDAAGAASRADPACASTPATAPPWVAAAGALTVVASPATASAAAATPIAAGTGAPTPLHGAAAADTPRHTAAVRATATGKPAAVGKDVAPAEADAAGQGPATPGGDGGPAGAPPADLRARVVGEPAPTAPSTPAKPASGEDAGIAAKAALAPDGEDVAQPRFWCELSAEPSIVPTAGLASAAVPGATTGTSDTAPAAGRIATPPGEPGFAAEVGVALTTFIKDGVQQARLELNPGEMGPLTVRIRLDGQAAHVQLAAENAQTRQALEQAMPLLAGSLHEAGLTLGGGGVFEQPPAQSHAGDAGHAAQQREHRDGAAREQTAASRRHFSAEPGLAAEVAVQRHRGVVDLVA